MNKPTKTAKNDWFRSPEYLKNEIRFKLLVNLPSFQEDIKKIRKELEIPENGLGSGEGEQWYKNIHYKKSDDILNDRTYLDKLKKADSFRHTDYREYERLKWEANDMVPVNKIRNRLKVIGTKYRLPDNFLEPAFAGLCAYLVYGLCHPPVNNWSITNDEEARNGTAKWVAIQTYAPLSQRELKEAVKMLVEVQRTSFPKQILIGDRQKKTFDRDFEMYKKFLERKKNPRIKKSYTKGGYLDLLTKETDVPTKKLRRLENKNKSSIEMKFDEITYGEVAKEFKTNKSVVAKAVKRVKDKITQYFPNELSGT